MPWANGLGITTELAVSPHRRSSSPFIWRISIAGVTSDGVFSNFPNIERHIMLLEGMGIILEGGEKAVHHLDQLYKVHTFQGDAKIYGRLIDGPITDFNVMVDWRLAEARVETLSISKFHDIHLHDDVVFLHVLEGSNTVNVRVDHKSLNLESGDSYQIEDIDANAQLQCEFGEAAQVILVSIKLF